MPRFVNNLVIVGVFRGIAALDRATGSQGWRAAFWAEDYSAATDQLSVHSSHVCLGDYGGIGCAEVGTGQVVWSKHLPLTEQGATSAIDSWAWYVGTGDHRVHAFDPATGAERWIVDVTPGAQYSSRVFGVAVAGDSVYVTTVRLLTSQGGSVAGDLIALDRQTGQVLWRYTTPGQKGGFQGAPVLAGRLLVMNDVYAHALVAVDRFSGQEVWRTAQGQEGYITSEEAAVVVGDTVFAASTDTQIYAIDSKTGATIWHALGNRGSLLSLAVCGDYLLARTASLEVIAMNRETRQTTPLAGLASGDGVVSQIAVQGNVAYFTSAQGVYAYACE